jgi:radical SAM protein with 4Fe4S-binding SPASM domain
MNIIDIRIKQQSGAHDLYSTLRSVEINPIELCNRTCEFCPRSNDDLYQNQKLKINLELVTKIAHDLNEMQFTGRVGFVGFGEPLLHNKLTECINLIKTLVPTVTSIEVNTNGDFLTKSKVKDLVDAGCNTLTVSMYDLDDSAKFESFTEGLDVELTTRHHYNKEDNFNLFLVNRIDLAQPESIHLDINRPCYIPFYKLFIDWNGDILVCNNDWGRASNLGNVTKESIKDIWLGEKFSTYRTELLKGNRASCVPCKRCNVDGTKLGHDSVRLLSNYK